MKRHFRVTEVYAFRGLNDLFDRELDDTFLIEKNTAIIEGYKTSIAIADGSDHSFHPYTFRYRAVLCPGKLAALKTGLQRMHFPAPITGISLTLLRR